MRHRKPNEIAEVSRRAAATTRPDVSLCDEVSAASCVDTRRRMLGSWHLLGLAGRAMRRRGARDENKTRKGAALSSYINHSRQSRLESPVTVTVMLHFRWSRRECCCC